MLKWALILVLISLIASAFGFREVAAERAGTAKFLFFGAVVLFAMLAIIGVFLVG